MRRGAAPADDPGAVAPIRWGLWAGAGILAAVCGVALLLWGLHGPAYILDLIAAYCF
ncbi:MAG TPA: hypothetical protein VGD36_08760 [Xanthobacteraceae bacterium]